MHLNQFKFFSCLKLIKLLSKFFFHFVNVEMWKVACVIAVIYAAAYATPFDHLLEINSEDDVVKIYGESSVPDENGRVKNRK